MKVLVLLACLLLSAQLAAENRIDVVSYRARLTVEPTGHTIDGEVTVTFRNVMRSDINSIQLDARTLCTDRVEREGIPLDYSVNDSVIFIQLDTPVRSLDTATVTVWYHGSPSFGDYEHAGVHFGPRSVWAHPQSAHVRYVAMTPHWLPCNNEFSDKAIYDITFDTPLGWRAAGMGTLVDEAENGNRQLTHWRLRDPIHPAGAGWSVGQYEVYADSIRGIPFCAYVWPEWKGYAKNFFRTIDSIIAVLETHFGPYPGEKIGFVLTDSSSVETHTIILLYVKQMSGYAAAYTLEGHELAHHWWGNSVTPMSIEENWLSEGFAMYGEWLITAALSNRRTFDGILREYTNYYRVQEAPVEGALPLYDYMGAGAKYNYSSVIYIKGAIVLNMLRHWMGDERFYDGLRDYFQRYSGKNATSAIFRDVMEEHLDESLEQYFTQWVYSGGWPILSVEELSPSPTGALRIGLQQLQQDENGWPLFETPVDIEVVSKSGDTLVVRRMLHALKQDMFIINELSYDDIASWRLDPDGWLLHESRMVTSVEPTAAALRTPLLESCYPHPLQRGASQSMQPYSIPQAGVVHLELQDLLGRRLRVLADEWMTAGRHVLPIELPGLAAGQYRLQLRTTEGVASRILLVR